MPLRITSIPSSRRARVGGEVRPERWKRALLGVLPESTVAGSSDLSNLLLAEQRGDGSGVPPLPPARPRYMQPSIPWLAVAIVMAAVGSVAFLKALIYDFPTWVIQLSGAAALASLSFLWWESWKFTVRAPDNVVPTKGRHTGKCAAAQPSGADGEPTPKGAS